MARFRLAALATICAFAATSAFAQAPPIPDRLTLDDALRLAAERSPQAAAARAAVAIAESGRLDAGARPNPAVTIESEGYPLFEPARPPFSENQELTVRLDQELETAGRRRLRMQAADASVAAATLSGRDRLRQLELQVRRAYLQLVLAQADGDVARTSLEEIDRVLGVSRERAQLGEIARADVSRLEVERLRFAEDAFSAELALRNARAVLLALVGATDLTQAIEATEGLALTAVAGVPTAAAAVPPPPLQASEARPDLLAAREELRRADTETLLQRALRSPNITVGGGYKRDFGTNAVVFGITLPVPLWNRNQAGIARARAERQLAESNLAATALDVKLDVQQAFNAMETNRARVAYIEERVLASARNARDVVAESYQLGAATLIDLLDAQRGYRDTLRTYNRSLFDYRLSVFELQAARGHTSIQ